jgi:glycine/D-amino acid oxidase-like deaminating enzyme
MSSQHSIAVIGAGFYGLMLAQKAASTGAKVTVFESAPSLGLGASWANQARIHGGYHYPRDVRTGARSRLGLKRFVDDFGSAVFQDFTMLYGIARNGSKVTAEQFEAFCRRIDAPHKAASKEHKELFTPSLISVVYEVQEPAFNSDTLLAEAFERATRKGAQVNLGTRVIKVIEQLGKLEVQTDSAGNELFDFVLDCTYSKLGTLFEPAVSLKALIKLERAEICLVMPPENLESLGITVMDGPFFSWMPFPTRGLHSLTHVSYTPRASSQPTFSQESDRTDVSAYTRIKADVVRYVPALEKMKHESSIFTDKAILVSSEIDDARPALVQESGKLGRYISVLGSKIDTVYDAVESVFTQTELRSTL